MKISQIFPSKYVAAADLNGKPVTLTIRTVTLEEMVTHNEERVKKPVAWFEKATKGFVMNVTNARIIADLYGDETESWAGKRISIYPTRVQAFGKMQDCIRVKPEIPAQPTPAAQQSTPAEDRSPLDDDEDVADFAEHEHDDSMWDAEAQS